MYYALAAALVALLLVLFSYLAFSYVFKRRKKEELFYGLMGDVDGAKLIRRELIEKLLAVPYEEVWVKSFDGRRIYARYYGAGEDRPTVIMMHGYKSMAFRDFSGIFDEFSSLGFNILLADERAHGKSEGRSISFGIRERWDAIALSRYVQAVTPRSKIFLMGVSMGASAVIMASELDTPPSLVGIIADCPFTSPSEIIKKSIADKGLPKNLFYFFARLGAVIFAGFDPSSHSARAAISKTDIPILIIHGEADRVTPIEMSEELSESARGRVTLVKIPDATHTTSVIYGREKYKAALKKFTDEVLNQKGKPDGN